MFYYLFLCIYGLKIYDFILSSARMKSKVDIDIKRRKKERNRE